MAVLEQEFTVANVIRVTRKVAIHDFPEFPHDGTLIVLQPPCVVSGRELSGYDAEVTTGRGRTIRITFEHWHMNDDHVIGLLSRKADASAILLRSKVRFLKR
jgi:hypothetical protein